jgi:hypothetical protein
MMAGILGGMGLRQQHLYRIIRSAKVMRIETPR